MNSPNEGVLPGVNYIPVKVESSRALEARGDGPMHQVPGGRAKLLLMHQLG